MKELLRRLGLGRASELEEARSFALRSSSFVPDLNVLKLSGNGLRRPLDADERERRRGRRKSARLARRGNRR